MIDYEIVGVYSTIAFGNNYTKKGNKYTFICIYCR